MVGGLDNNWTRNDRGAPNFLTQNCFCRNSLVVSSSSSKATCPFGLPPFSERAVSMLVPSSLRCFTGSMLVGLVPRLHMEPDSVNVLLSSSKVHLNLLRKMAEAHSVLTAFDRCKYRSHSEATQNYIVTSLDQHSIRERPSAVTVA